MKENQGASALNMQLFNIRYSKHIHIDAAEA